MQFRSPRYDLNCKQLVKVPYGIIHKPNYCQCPFTNNHRDETSKLKGQIEELNKTISSLLLKRGTIETNESFENSIKSVMGQMKSRIKRRESKDGDTSMEFRDSTKNYQDEEFKISTEEHVERLISEENELELLVNGKDTFKAKTSNQSKSLSKRELAEESTEFNKHWSEMYLMWKAMMQKFNEEIKTIKENIYSTRLTQKKINEQVINKVKKTIEMYEEKLNDCQCSMERLKTQYDKALVDNKIFMSQSAIKSPFKSPSSSGITSATQEDILNSLRELQERLESIKEIIMHKIRSISIELKEIKNKVISKVKSQLAIEPPTYTKDQYTINSSLNKSHNLIEDSTELYHTQGEVLLDNNDYLKTPQPLMDREESVSVQRLNTARVVAGNLTAKESQRASCASNDYEEEKSPSKVFFFREPYNEDVLEEESSIDDIDDLIQPIVVLEDKRRSDDEEEDVIMSVNALCVDNNEQYIVVS